MNATRRSLGESLKPHIVCSEENYQEGQCRNVEPQNIRTYRRQPFKPILTRIVADAHENAETSAARIPIINEFMVLT